MSDIKIGDHVPIELVEQAHIRAVVASSKTLGQAADTLGIDFATLYRKRKRWGDQPGRRGGRMLEATKPAPAPAPVAEPEPVAKPEPEPEPVVVRPPVERPGVMTWPVKPPDGMSLEIHNLGFWSILRIGLRLLEPKGATAALWVTHTALEIVECLPMWQPRIVRERCNGSQVGWLGVQATVPMLTHFTGWNVFLDDGLEVPFDMRANGKTVKGAFE